MPDTYFYSSNPGKAVLAGKGSVVNIVKAGQVAQIQAFGAGVMGAVGTVVNDLGEPGVPLLLRDGADTLFSDYGGFQSWLGGDESTAYEGNLAAQVYGLSTPYLVIVPVDMALKDKTITDDTAVDLLVRFTRGWNVTGSNDGELITTRDAAGNVVAHGLAVNDQIYLEALTGGTGGTLTTALDSSRVVFVKTVESASVITVAATQGGALLTFAVDISAPSTAYPVAAVNHDIAPYTIRAGARLRNTGGTFIVATLEDVDWDENVGTTTSVRVQKVSGTEVDLNTLLTFVDAPTDSDGLVIITTIETTNVFEPTDAEIALRYAAAFQALNSNADGLLVSHVAWDRTASAVNNAAYAASLDHQSQGFFWLPIGASPIGTTVADAIDDTGDGSQRVTYLGESVQLFPAWKRPFILDSARLVGPNYMARFTGTMPLAARGAQQLPEENLAYPLQTGADPLVRYGLSQIDQTLTKTQKEQLWAAGIMTPAFRPMPTGPIPTYRDGVMTNGVEVSYKRLFDFLAKGLTALMTPFHQAVAMLSERTQMKLQAISYLEKLLKPSAGDRQRIAGYDQPAVTWDSVLKMATLTITVYELGTMNVLTLELNLSSDNITLSLAA